jgi:hypothetical protein
MSDAGNQAELMGLLSAHADNCLSEAQRLRLIELLRSGPDARDALIEHAFLEASLTFEARGDSFKAEVLSRSRLAANGRRTTDIATGGAPQNGMTSDGSGPIACGTAHRPPVTGFLNALRRVGYATPAANALMWMVMAVLCSGIVLTIFFCITLLLRGVHVRVDAPQVAGRNNDGEMGRAGDGGSGRSLAISPSPHLPISPSSNSTVARLIHADDCRWAIGSHSPHVGDDLEPGRRLVLLSGLAEVMFESGVRALLQGPATMEIGSRSSTRLERGKLTVRVEDPDARGFEVRTSGMKYTDLGTEFGVWVKKNGTQEMVVFRGSVRAERADDGEKGRWGDREIEAPTVSPSPHLPISPSSIVVTASQAVRIAAPGKPMERLKAEENRFVRAMPAPAPFALSSTGLGLERGAADPHWDLTGISSDAGFKPQPAVVADPLPIYLRAGRGAAQWISSSRILKRMPDACRSTYRTRFDLAGFDVATVRIDGRLLVDDYVAAMRLNGTAVEVPAGARGPYRYSNWLEFKIEAGFVAGENTLEIVVENSSNAQSGYVNTMALCVECKGTARPLPALNTDE